MTEGYQATMTEGYQATMAGGYQATLFNAPTFLTLNLKKYKRQPLCQSSVAYTYYFCVYFDRSMAIGPQ